tara:strand:- start:2863 stop:3087 length:225 start_codon:yes stop_codon:yes gene_type:complete
MSNKKTDEVIENVSNAIEFRQQVAMDAMDIIMWMNKRINKLTVEVLDFRKEAEDRINHFMDMSNLMMDELRSEE